MGSNLTELIPIIQDRKEHFFILDHHEVDVDINNIKIPENLHFVNPTIYGYDGLDHIAGATLAYMFAKRIKLKPVIKQGWLTVIDLGVPEVKTALYVIVVAGAIGLGRFQKTMYHVSLIEG